MTHQIPPHLAFCTPRQNPKAEQGTNPETLKRDKQTQKPLHLSQWIWRNEEENKMISESFTDHHILPNAGGNELLEIFKNMILKTLK